MFMLLREIPGNGFFFQELFSGLSFCGYIFRYAELLANSPDELREEWYYKVIMKKLAKYGLVGLN